MYRIVKTALLLRPHNALAAALCVAAGWMLVSWPELPSWRLLLAVALATAAGNVINDYFDIDIDSINKPKRAIPSGTVSVKSARAIYCVLLVSLAAVLVFMPVIQALWIASWAVLLHIYSLKLKRVYLAGNVLVSLVAGSGFLLGAYAGGDSSAGIVPAVFTVLFVLGRELVKDSEDVEGDRRCGARTVPVVSGTTRALRSAAVIFLLLSAGFPVPYLAGRYSGIYGLIMFVSVLPILVLSSVLSIRGRDPGLVSILLKLGMFFGAIAFMFAAA